MPTKPQKSQREKSNLLLDAMNAAVRSGAKIRVQAIELERGAPVRERGERVRHVYFPLTCVLSLVAVLTDGTTVETAAVGYEGAFGLVAAVGSGEASSRCLVQIGGRALQSEASQLRSEFNRNEHVRSIVLRYSQTLLFQAQQTVACNARHPVEARLSRWLLAMHDRATDDSMSLTHEFLADLLGVNRTSITLAARALQGAGLIAYRRGVVSIVDRDRLEEVCCECYRSIREHYERLLG